MGKGLSVRFSGYSFGSVRVDGVTYDHDLIIDRGKIRKRSKGASRKFRGAYGHTPLSAAEDIPWRCRRLVIGTGADSALPVLKQVHEQARRREVELVILPTAQAISVLAKAIKDTNAILHLTC
ncbi:MAG TPA: MTH938/NDUFAF3 family protein [Streptosporangiaceae bacterium]